MRDIVNRLLREKGINVHLNTEISAVSSQGEDALHSLQATDGRTFPFDEVVWCTEVLVVA